MRAHAAWTAACAAWLLSALAASAQAGEIFVVRRGWHIDVGLKLGDVRAPLYAVAQQFSQTSYIFFGFADRHYLQSKHHGTSTLSGALWPGAGIVLVTAVSGTPQQAFGSKHVVALTASDAQTVLLQDFIRNSIATQPGQLPAPLQPGPYMGSLYFASSAGYSALHTCNTWAAESLRAANYPLHSNGVVFAGQLWHRVRRLVD